MSEAANGGRQRLGCALAATLVLACGACGEPPPAAPRPERPSAGEQASRPAPGAEGTPPAPAAPPELPEPPALPTPAAQPGGGAVSEAVPSPDSHAKTIPSLEELERRLKGTRALGVFTKLALKNEIDDLLRQLRAYHERHEGRLASLRERFDLLVMKGVSLLQDGDPALAEALARSRESLWVLLADPVQFARLSS